MPNLNDYLNLIPSQYQNSPKFKQWLTVLLTPLVDVQDLASNLDKYFDIDSAVGVQLDMLGHIVGASRLLPFTPTNGNPVLDDDDYRFLIKAQIARNTWHGTNEEIYDKWNELFTDVYISIKDNQDMTISLVFLGEFTQTQKDMIEHNMIVPKAQGVGFTYSYSIPPLFSLDQDTTFFKGFDEGDWMIIEY